jgi:hypothetical protein
VPPAPARSPSVRIIARGQVRTGQRGPHEFQTIEGVGHPRSLSHGKTEPGHARVELEGHAQGIPALPAFLLQPHQLLRAADKGDDFPLGHGAIVRVVHGPQKRNDIRSGRAFLEHDRLAHGPGGHGPRPGREEDPCRLAETVPIGVGFDHRRGIAGVRADSFIIGRQCVQVDPDPHMIVPDAHVMLPKKCCPPMA